MWILPLNLGVQSCPGSGGRILSVSSRQWTVTTRRNAVHGTPFIAPSGQTKHRAHDHEVVNARSPQKEKKKWGGGGLTKAIKASLTHLQLYCNPPPSMLLLPSFFRQVHLILNHNKSPLKQNVHGAVDGRNPRSACT